MHQHIFTFTFVLYSLPSWYIFWNCWIVCRCEGQTHSFFQSNGYCIPSITHITLLVPQIPFSDCPVKVTEKQKPLYHSGKFWCQARFWTWQPPHSAATHKWEMLHKSPRKYKRHRSWCLGHCNLSCRLAALALSCNDFAAALTSVAAVLLL